MYDESVLRQITFEECTKRAMDVKGVMKDPMWAPDAQGNMKMFNKPRGVHMQMHGPDLSRILGFDLKRRGLAFDMGAIMSFENHESLATMLLESLLKVPKKGNDKVYFEVKELYERLYKIPPVKTLHRAKYAAQAKGAAKTPTSVPKAFAPRFPNMGVYAAFRAACPHGDQYIKRGGRDQNNLWWRCDLCGQCWVRFEEPPPPPPAKGQPAVPAQPKHPAPSIPKMANMFGLGPADAYAQGQLHMYQQGLLTAGVVMAPPAQMTPEHQAETLRTYQLQLAAAAAVELQANAAAALQHPPPAQTTADGGDWLMAELAASEAETRPGEAPDPRAAQRAWTYQHVKTMMAGGLPQRRMR